MSIFAGIENVGRLRKGPTASKDFRRIQALPRREWEKAEDLAELTQLLTKDLKTPNGTQTLKPVQAAALRDVHDVGGLFGPIQVGGGKTLITLLAPVVCNAKRPLLLVPAALIKQTTQKVLPEARKHWKLHPNLKILSYSKLSMEKYANALDQGNHDFIILDECHEVKNKKSARSRRLNRYMNKNPETIVVDVSGTVANHSILDYWHSMQWALKPDNIPLPQNFYEAMFWADALDARVKDHDRRGPGCLTQLCKPGETARQGYRRRLTETPGVVATQEDQLGVGLRIDERKIEAPDEVNSLIHYTRNNWERPDGEIITEAARLARHLKEMACGFYYKWKEEPPIEWRRARSAWKKYVRNRISFNKKNLDTELQVTNECRFMERPPSEFAAWQTIKDSFEPETVPVWFDDFLLHDCSDWLHLERGICWVEFKAFGEALAKFSNLPYFGAGDDRILDHKGPCIASIEAHHKGKNLQYQWHKNLIVTPPTSGKRWEQLIGRTHRMGQPEDTVFCEVFQHHDVLIGAMNTAISDAEFLRDSLGNSQRLLYCDRSIP